MRATSKVLAFLAVLAISFGTGHFWGHRHADSEHNKVAVGVVNLSPQPSTYELVKSAAASETPKVSHWDTYFSRRLDIKLLAQFDSNGPVAWDPTKHPLVYITTNGPGYGGFMSGTASPGIAIIDANTYDIILEKQFKLEGVDPKDYWEDHGVGVSPDGKWIYLPTGDASKPIDQAGRLIIINAKTLKVHQVLQTSSYPHHVKTVDYYDGRVKKNLVLVENFNWQNPGSMAPGSGVYVLDPADNNRVVGGFRSEDVQGNPYLAFPHPGGRYLYVGLPPGAISDPAIRHQLEGTVAVIDMTTWKPVKYFKAGFDPIWVSFSADGRYAYVGDGGSDEIIKIDNVALKEISRSRSSVHGGYGLALNWDETKLYVVEKGEASHNRGKNLGLVNPNAMAPVDEFATHCLRGDHALVHPDPDKNELWISYNSNFRDVVFDMKTDTVKKTINHSGSSHNGAFVLYEVRADETWQGVVLSDQSGLHASARAAKEDKLGIKEIVWKNEKVSVDVFRGASASTPDSSGSKPLSRGERREITIKITAKGFNDKPDFVLTVNKGDAVKLTFINGDPYGDVHPIVFAGLNAAPVLLTREQKTATVEFVADTAGSFGFACQNQWCNIHPTLLGKIEVK